MPEEEVRLEGKVKSFNANSGWGFIQCPAAGADVFFAKQDVNGWITAKGDPVSFTKVAGEKGPKAVGIRLLPSFKEGSVTFLGELKSFDAENRTGLLTSVAYSELFQKEISVRGSQLKNNTELGTQVQFKVRTSEGAAAAFDVQVVAGPPAKVERERKGSSDSIDKEEEQEAENALLAHNRAQNARLATVHSTKQKHQILKQKRKQERLEKANKEDEEKANDLGGGFDSMREAYGSLGPDAYYKAHGADYRNPHEEVLIEALSLGLTSLEDAGLIDCSSKEMRILDVGCGSGEGSLGIIQWTEERACRRPASITAADPYTYDAFQERMRLPCNRWSFHDIANGVLEEEGTFNVVIAAFCLHLLDKSYLQATLAALARVCDVLVIASPHKRPQITASHRWDAAVDDILHERVHVRCYKSLDRPQDRKTVLLAARAAAAAKAAWEAEEAERRAAEEAEEKEEQRMKEMAAAAEIEEQDAEALQRKKEEELVDRISTMNVSRLTKELAKLQLKTTGKRNELAARLLKAYLGDADEDESESEDDEDEELKREMKLAAEKKKIAKDLKKMAKEQARKEALAAEREEKAKDVKEQVEEDDDEDDGDDLLLRLAATKNKGRSGSDSKAVEDEDRENEDDAKKSKFSPPRR
eukprot:TRINITY_DN3455_c1_g1_i1.p1 TRINITY_DN3455_c1_g1~~TRINITY_DN3455_c1_g1_i1.p1  ORF type:complete len:643 (+),score=176.64 TRINITY_DN3455_c1_g1_i1:75-2003(+)